MRLRSLNLDDDKFTDVDVKQVTWAELEEKVGLLCSFLERTPVLQRGDRLGVLGRNSTEYLQVRYIRSVFFGQPTVSIAFQISSVGVRQPATLLCRRVVHRIYLVYIYCCTSGRSPAGVLQYIQK